MSEISSKTTVQRRSDLLANDVSESETVMLDITAGSYYGLRDVSKAIWDRLAAPVSVDELCEDLMAEFDVDRPTCERETIGFLNQLRERGLVVITGA
ncbi:MAG: PqqD family peptide modification chaperone [Propionibacteriaceae bacterium]|nr:PqqD family peptide modification chaperone [Propionibacteriaceae bacterium]